jgi:AdoMet-dependent rRNA methyltransferase SPB1
MLVNSKKAKNQLIDDSYNRYSTFDDPNDLPNWFKEDEEKNFRKPLQVSKQALTDYKKRFDDINSRPIKKVVEAQARKKKRVNH